MNAPTIRPDVIRRWVAALRSGDYVQGSYYLARRSSTQADAHFQFCCLGVLCELAVLDGVATATTRLDNDDREFRVYDGVSGALPDTVLKWSGLPCAIPSVDVGGNVMLALNWLNDRRRASFDEIANVIERTYLPNENGS